MGNIETKTSSSSADDTSLGAFRKTAMRGALWVTVISVAAIPLTYYRSWILGRMGEGGLVVGSLALIVLFVNLVSTFVLYGGVTVVANYLPKLQSSKEKCDFLGTYGLISFVPVLVAILLVAIYPEFLTWVLKGNIAQGSTIYFLLLIPLVVVANIMNYAQAGMMDFRSSAMLNQFPTLVTCVVATTGFFLFPTQLASYSLPILACCFILAYFLMLIIGGIRVFRLLGSFRFRLFLPVGFWRYASFIHLNTITPFVYGSMDQIFVLTAIGIEELGAYFVMVQIARLCSFIPTRIAQVMLASFSHLVGQGENKLLSRAYQRLCRLTVVSTTLLVLLVIFMSPWLASLYGSFFETRYRYLIVLVALVSIGSVGTINSMLIMAKERSGFFLINNITVVIVQFFVTLALLKQYGVYAVIVGRAVAVSLGQVGNFSIIRWGLPGVSLAPPYEYWISLLVAVSSALVAFSVDRLSTMLSLLLLIGASFAFLAAVRFKPSEIVKLLPQRSGQCSKRGQL